MRLWYLRRALPWRELAGCGIVAVVMTAAVHRWPGTADLLVPFTLAACAAAAGFLLDEAASPVVRVTVRGGRWRLLARLALVTLPVLLWAGIVWTLPAAATTQTSALLGAGVSGCLLCGGGAAALAAAGVEKPGTHVSAAVVGLTTVPFVLGPLLGWDPLFPVNPVADWVATLWWGIGVLGVLLAVLGLRRTPHRAILPGRGGAPHQDLRSGSYRSQRDRDRRVRADHRR